MSRPDQAPPFSRTVRLDAVGRLDRPVPLEPDAAERARIAKALDLVDLLALSGRARVAPWHDGVEIEAEWSATVVYRCGVSLESFAAELEGDFTVRAVPASSPLAVPPEGEIDLDTEAPDPPDVLDGETIDLGAYLVEHLALELDPFPRKPGAVFEPPPAEEPESPFAVLKRLQPKGEEPKG